MWNARVRSSGVLGDGEPAVAATEASPAAEGKSAPSPSASSVATGAGAGNGEAKAGEDNKPAHRLKRKTRLLKHVNHQGLHGMTALMWAAASHE